MPFTGLVIKLEGRVSTHGPIDEARRAAIHNIITGIKGIHRCHVSYSVQGTTQRVIIKIPFGTRGAIDRLDCLLRGIGGLPVFFSTRADPIITRVT